MKGVCKIPIPYTDESIIVNAIVAMQTQLHNDLLAVQSRIDLTNNKLDLVNVNLTTIITRLDTIIIRLDTIIARLETIIARLDTIIVRLNTIIDRLDTIIVRLNTIIQWLTDIFNKLEEIRVFHHRYIAERRLPRTSAATLLMSELFGNEDLDDDSDHAIYGKDFILDPTDASIPPIFGGGLFSQVDEFGETIDVNIFPVDPNAPTKTWQEYLDTIPDESYHP